MGRPEHQVPLTAPQKVGIASFCPYNIGPGKCFPSTFYRKLNAGDRKGRALKFVVGSLMVAVTAASPKARRKVATVRLSDVTRKRLDVLGIDK